MKERPIIFTADSVRAILAGNKTQTRRMIKPQPPLPLVRMLDGGWCELRGCTALGDTDYRCPYGAPGDRLWVKETFAFECDVDGNEPPYSDRPIKRTGDDEVGNGWLMPHYRATDPMPDLCCGHKKCDGEPCTNPWRSPMFMPRWASRITLAITDVRVQRVQEISGDDVLAEGVDNGSSNPTMGARWENMQRMAFEKLWDSINAKRGYSWESNPWVWAVTFNKV